jgi:hypothetical protein
MSCRDMMRVGAADAWPAADAALGSRAEDFEENAAGRSFNFVR